MNRLDELSKQTIDQHEENMKLYNIIMGEATILLYEMQAIKKRLEEGKQHEHYR